MTTDGRLLRRGADTLSTILDAEAFASTDHAAFAYRLTYAGHSQLGSSGHSPSMHSATAVS